MLNQVSLIGNLGQDPDIRTTQGGSRVAIFQVATEESYRKRETGEMVAKTEWHRVVVFGDSLIAKLIEPHLRKGYQVFVQGSLRTRSWTDQGGVKRYTTEVVLGGSNSKIRIVRGTGERQSQGSQSPEKPNNGSTPPVPQDSWPPTDLGDEIPF